jgi:hypothetical protein
MISTFEFSENIVGILIKTDMDVTSIGEVHDVVLERLKDHEKISLYVEIEAGVHLSVPAFFKDLVFKYKNSKNFNRIAVVTDLTWFQNIMEIKDLLMDAEVKSFKIKNRLNAINWIAE